MSEGHDSRAIANRFVEISKEKNDRLTILSLVKFVYLAHGWTLGHEGRPLIKHKVEAWRYGPVVPEVYSAFRPQGIVITKKAKKFLGVGGEYKFETKLTDSEESIINDVYKEYSTLRPSELTAITHGRGTPWGRYRGHFYHTIPNEEIQGYYMKVIEMIRSRKAAQK